MKKIIIGNWKMNPLSLKEAEKLFSAVAKGVSGIKKTEIVICSPFIYLQSLLHLAKSKKQKAKTSLGAQDAFYGDVGAFTGEISAEMLYSIGVRYVVLGHSERRAMGEKNEIINKKIKSAISSGLKVILCVGERERDENHEYLNFIKSQIEECFSGIQKNSISSIIIAYEPIWAIGKSAVREAVSEEFREMKVFIKKILSDKFSSEITEKIRIIYGGSVNFKNALGFLIEGSSDGFLVGRDSLDAKKFLEIIKICETLNN